MSNYYKKWADLRKQSVLAGKINEAKVEKIKEAMMDTVIQTSWYGRRKLQLTDSGRVLIDGSAPRVGEEGFNQLLEFVEEVYDAGRVHGKVETDFFNQSQEKSGLTQR